MSTPRAMLIAAASLMATLAAPAQAITNGSPDGVAHPYVGVASSGDEFCSGTLLSPRVFLTAGHCTADFSAGGQPIYVTFDPSAGRNSRYITGKPYTEPGFFNAPPQGTGVPASIGHDLGVIVLDEPVALPVYGRLPGPGALDRVSRAPVTLVGYGASGSIPGPHGRTPIFTFVRTNALATLINDGNANGGEFVLVSTNPGGGRGGIGRGDSGAPALLDGTATLAAIGSHVTSCGCGSAYFSRLDTAEARGFIVPFLTP